MVIKPVKCRKIKKLLQIYIDNALNLGEKEEVKEHLKECPTCRAELKALSSLVKTLKSLPEIAPPPGFTEKVMSKIYQVKDKERKSHSQIGRNL